jgi:hypothetical protein
MTPWHSVAGLGGFTTPSAFWLHGRLFTVVSTGTRLRVTGFAGGTVDNASSAALIWPTTTAICLNSASSPWKRTLNPSSPAAWTRLKLSTHSLWLNTGV